MYIRERWEEPGVTLGSMAVEDAQSIWDMAKLRDCMVPRPCQELNPSCRVLSVSKDLCPGMRGETW